MLARKSKGWPRVSVSVNSGLVHGSASRVPRHFDASSWRAPPDPSPWPQALTTKAAELSTSLPFLTVVLTDRESDADATAVLEAFLSQYTGAGDRPLTLAAEAELASPRDGAPASLVEAVGRSSRLRDLVSTVDNATLFTGWAATVLAAENLERTGQIGHYGIAGSDGLLPEAPS